MTKEFIHGKWKAMFLADEKVPAFMNEMLELMYETESDMVFSATMAVEKVSGNNYGSAIKRKYPAGIV